MAPYFSYFLNFFLTLVISRPNFRALAQYTRDALKGAGLGPLFDPFIQDLDTAIAGFDVNLIQREDPTAGDTEAFRQARAQWLHFVLEVQVKVVNPAMFGKTALKDFRKFTHGKLAALDQDELPILSDALVVLLGDHQAVLQPLYAAHFPTPAGQQPQTLVAKATELVTSVRDADSARDQAFATVDTTIQNLAKDWVALARALNRAKAMLELTFDDPKDVYRFFDFSKAKTTKRPSGGNKKNPPA